MWPRISYDRFRLSIFSLLFVALLPACSTFPEQGDHFVMVVTHIPTEYHQLQYHPGMSLALKRGVTKEDVWSGRLVSSGCYDEKETHNPGTDRRHGFSFIPEGTAVKKGEIIEVKAEEAEGKHFQYARFFGRYSKKHIPKESEYFPYKYSLSGKEFRCGTVSPEGDMLVEVYNRVEPWYYSLAKAEESRNNQIGEEELKQGRIVVGKCSPGVDFLLFWKVRIPHDLEVKVGDYIEAIAGPYEQSFLSGPLSKAVQKIPPPDKKALVETYGLQTINCNAHAKPFIDRNN